MRRFIYILVAAAASLMLASCNKEPLPTVDGMIGTWQLVSIDGDELMTKSFSDAEGLDVKITFAQDTFVLNQRAGSNTEYTTYTGKWTLSKNILSGTYSDGSPWSSTYKVAINGRSMTLESSSETQVYKKID